jgi:hypothetical protein
LGNDIVSSVFVKRYVAPPLRFFFPFPNNSTAQVFPEGLAPLASKLDELVHRSVRKAGKQASRPGAMGGFRCMLADPNIF